MKSYVHGYSQKEACRLQDQAETLTDLLHHDTVYAPGTRVLEAGCGTGAQTVILAKASPGAAFECVDLSGRSLARAKALAQEQKLSNVSFCQGDIYNLPYAAATFDHAFICFVLEHLAAPEKTLSALKQVLKPGGSLTVIEGDHGSFYCHPKSREADLAVQCLIQIQSHLGGDALIGRRLYPLLVNAGFSEVRISPRLVYADASKPALVEGFTKKTFTAMVAAVRDQALSMGLADRRTWEKGIADLYRAAEDDGTFCYTFFKGCGIHP